MAQLQLTREQASVLSMAIMQRCMKIEELLQIFERQGIVEAVMQDYNEEMATLKEIKLRLSWLSIINDL